MRNKVFIGVNDIASFIGDWAAGFSANNYDAIKGSLTYQKPVQNSNLDFVVKKAQDRIGYFKPGRISIKVKPWWDKRVHEYYFKKALKECGVFVFIWGSFYPDYKDYKILKDAGKKIITLFLGDDVRWQPAMKQEFQRIGFPVIEYDDYDYSCSGLNDKLEFLRTAEKYSDIILSAPNAMQMALRPYQNIFIPIVLDEFFENNIQRKIPIIIHAPTAASGKGSKYIDEVIDRLNKEGVGFEYVRLSRLKRKEALEKYLDADIVIDQLLTPGGGKLAHECLAMGKIVLTFVGNNEYDQLKPADCPLVDVRPETLYDSLVNLIPNVALRTDIASKGRPYIKKYHDPKKIVSNLLNQLENDYTLPDYTPSFFREKFIPESKDATRVYNKWNNSVKDCDWYKETVPEGERAGLKF
jgi:hypothetical protein